MRSGREKAPRFVGEPIEPEADAFDPARLAMGEPDAPRRFRWRDRPFAVTTLLRRWRSFKTDRGEKYVDRHWFEVETESGEVMRLYCDRRPRTTERRWWLFSVQRGGMLPDGAPVHPRQEAGE